MEFTIARIELLAAVNKCLVVTDDKSPNHAFRMVRVETAKKRAKFTAVGELSSVFTVAPNESKTPGQFTVSPKRLHDIATSMPEGQITFSLKGTRVTAKSKVSSRKATFESSTVDPHMVDDPGDSVGWRDVGSRELVRCLSLTSAAATWESGSDRPVQHLLIPRESGMLAFACNGYSVAAVTSSVKIDGDPIVVPQISSKVLALMTDTDDNVSVFSDSSRVYFKNCDTLTSSMLSPFQPQNYDTILSILDSEQNVVGPTMSMRRFIDSVKSVLKLSSFASNNEKGSRGYQLKISFGPEIVTELGFSEADARDEFEAIKDSGQSFTCLLSSKFLESMLHGMAGTEEAQVLHGSNMLILRSQGVTCGVMEERPE